MPFKPLLMALLASITLSAQGTAKPVPHTPTTPPTSTGAIQPVRIMIAKPDGPEDGSGFGYSPKEMAVWKENGWFYKNWSIPAGKTLVVTDITLDVVLKEVRPTDLDGMLEIMQAQGVSFPIFQFRVPANQSRTVITQSFQTGFCFTMNLPPSFFFYFAAPSPQQNIGSASLVLGGYLRDSQ